MTIRYVTFDGIVAYHAQVMRSSSQPPLLISPEKLGAAIARPQSTVSGEEAFPSLPQKAGALLQSIVVGHPFLDGNKRAGLGAMLAFLELNEIPVDVADDDALCDFVIAVTTGELREVEDIARRLQELFAPHLD